MLLKIDEECLKEAQTLAMALHTLSLQGLNVNGIVATKPLIEQLDKLDKKSEEYQVLVDMIVNKMVNDFDSYI